MRTDLRWAPEIPAHWSVVPLNYVARMGTGHTPDRNKTEYWKDCIVPWVTIRDATSAPDSLKPLTDTSQKISMLGLANSAAVVHPAGTVMLSRTASVGYSVVVDMPMATSQDFVTWSPGPRLDSQFLLLVLRSMKPEWQRLAFGSTHRTIYMPDLEALRIPLPPLDEQRRIVKFIQGELLGADILAAKRLRVLQLIRLRFQAEVDVQMQNLVQKYGEVPFRRLANFFEQGVSPQCESIPAGDDEWGVLKVSAVKGGTFVSAENKRLPVTMSSARKYELKSGDLLITRANTPKLVGDVALVEQVRPKLLLCDKIFRVTISDNLDPRFFVAVARSTKLRSLCWEVSHGSSQSMANLKVDEIKRWPIPQVPMSVQKRVVGHLDASRSRNVLLAEALVKQSEVLAERRQALITAAVTGQLDMSTGSGATG